MSKFERGRASVGAPFISFLTLVIVCGFMVVANSQCANATQQLCLSTTCSLQYYILTGSALYPTAGLNCSVNCPAAPMFACNAANCPGYKWMINPATGVLACVYDCVNGANLLSCGYPLSSCWQYYWNGISCVYNCSLDRQGLCGVSSQCTGYAWTTGASGFASCQYNCQYMNSISTCSATNCPSYMLTNTVPAVCQVNCTSATFSLCNLANCNAYFYSMQYQACITCTSINPNCLQCVNGICLMCGAGQVVSTSDATMCIPSNPCSVSHCNSCNSQGSCVSCGTNYYLSSGSLCVSDICSPIIVNCQRCLTTSTCAICLPGYALALNAMQCTIKCMPNCQNCRIISICDQCLPGYKFDLVNLACIPTCSLPNCQSCLDPLTCSVCQMGFQPDPKGVSCIPTCMISNCLICTNTSYCLGCATGYILANSTYCARDICFISNCQACASATTCASCALPYILATGGASCNPPATTPFCISYSVLTTAPSCVGCLQGYVLNQAGTMCTPSCTILNCNICLNSNGIASCFQCNNGYTPATNGQSCVGNCQINNCVVCAPGGTSCTTCAQNYIVSSTGLACLFICPDGMYQSGSTTCLSCRTVVSNCLTCVQMPSTLATLCLSCYPGTFLDATNNCTACNATLTNCTTCTNSSYCVSCSAGMVAMNGVCYAGASCNVPNCIVCMNSACIQCQSGFMISGSSCIVSSCQSGLYFNGTTCTCPMGLTQSQYSCIACPPFCVECTALSCLKCVQSYVLSLLSNSNVSTCVACALNCQKCVVASTCLRCLPGYVWTGSICAMVPNGAISVGSASGARTYVLCASGCRDCNIAVNGALACTKLAPGFNFDSQGNTYPCPLGCKKCTSRQVCSTCFDTYSLIITSCGLCSGQFCRSCPLSPNYCTSCISGYGSSSTGSCVLCGQGCLSCDVAGAGNCDPGRCAQGYVMQDGLNNCTECFNGCSQCKSSNLSICTGCPLGKYLSTTLSYCLPCSGNCTACTSANVCTNCAYGYVLSTSSTCLIQISAFPCLFTNPSNGGCSVCYFGYSLGTGGGCIPNTACTNCTFCPSTHYLSNGVCNLCTQILPGCETCNSATDVVCLRCQKGSYVAGGACVGCPAGCAVCGEGGLCIYAQPGYYIDFKADGSPSGISPACDTICLTCNGTAHSCTSCPPNYNLVGFKCITAYNITLTSFFTPTFLLPYNSSTFITNSPTFQNGLLMEYFPYVKTGLCQIYGCYNLTYLTIHNYTFNYSTANKLGVVVVNSTMAFDPSQDPNTVFNNIANASYGALGPVSTLKTANGFSNYVPPKPVSSSNANLGLILGLAIPFGLLLLALLIFLIWKFTKDDEEEEEPKPESNPQSNPSSEPKELQPESHRNLKTASTLNMK